MKMLEAKVEIAPMSMEEPAQDNEQRGQSTQVSEGRGSRARGHKRWGLQNHDQDQQGPLIRSRRKQEAKAPQIDPGCIAQVTTELGKKSPWPRESRTRGGDPDVNLRQVSCTQERL